MPIALTAVIPVLLSGAGGGVAYTITNIAYKTFSYPINEVEAANHEALKKMHIEEIERSEEEDWVQITAATKRLKIYIEFERITPTTTKIKVNAKRGMVFKDKATATEIIEQTERILEGKGIIQIPPAGTV
jgi:NADPH:quinone reductase-like Zn-dependent oxidoreductase